MLRRLFPRRPSPAAATVPAGTPRPCTAVACRRPDGAILLLRKIPRPGGIAGWVTPGGRLERGEPLLDCARRELFEEAGLWLDRRRFRRSPVVTESVVPDGPHLVGLVFEIDVDWAEARSAVNREPDRHDHLGWFTAALVEHMAADGLLFDGVRAYLDAARRGGRFLPTTREP